MGRFSTRGEVARRERVEYALVRCTQLSTVVSDPRSTIHEPLSLPLLPPFFVKKRREENSYGISHRVRFGEGGVVSLLPEEEEKNEEEDEVKKVWAAEGKEK